METDQIEIRRSVVSPKWKRGFLREMLVRSTISTIGDAVGSLTRAERICLSFGPGKKICDRKNMILYYRLGTDCDIRGGDRRTVKMFSMWQRQRGVIFMPDILWLLDDDSPKPGLRANRECIMSPLLMAQ